jgi:1,5-anhydro-D-fructose reductase (1,5-anhydro-D-mannitol-forming)
VSEVARPLGWAFLGASSWAETRLLPAVTAVDDARPVGVLSSSPARGEEFAVAGGLERSYRSLEELLADPAVDVVYVSTTNERHAELTVAAARAGRAVLCEKPLATNLEDARRMVDECAAAGVVLGVNHHLRAAPTIAAMRELIAIGAIGEVLAARVAHARELPEALRGWRLDRPEAGAGVIFDITVHDVDTIRFLLADEVAAVSAVTANGGLAAAGVEDSAMGVLRMRGGPLVSFHDSFTVPHAATGVEVHGTTGSLIAGEAMLPDPVGEVVLRRGDRIEPVELGPRRPLAETAVRRFCAAVRGEGRPLAAGEDGVASVAVALAALESARGGAVVELPGAPTELRTTHQEEPG